MVVLVGQVKAEVAEVAVLRRQEILLNQLVAQQVLELHLVLQDHL